MKKKLEFETKNPGTLVELEKLAVVLQRLTDIEAKQNVILDALALIIMRLVEDTSVYEQWIQKFRELTEKNLDGLEYKNTEDLSRILEVFKGLENRNN